MWSDSRSTCSDSTSGSGSASATNVTNLITLQLRRHLSYNLRQCRRCICSRRCVVAREGIRSSFLVAAAARGVTSRSDRPLASSSSLTTFSNWRNSMSSTNTSTSTFTWYSNQSIRSVWTFATSASASSAPSSTNWRNPQSPTIPSSPSQATSVHSGKGNQPQSNPNTNNSLP
jgi:hypothetical protein